MPPPAEGFAARLVLGPALRSQPDRRLVALVREGYESAFEEIVRRYGKPLTRYAAAIVILSGKAGGLSSTFDVSWYYLLGGLLGAVYVANALIAVTAIGAGGVAAATITGQLTFSVLIDRFGLFGLDQVALGPERVAGIVLLLAGTVLIVR